MGAKPSRKPEPHARELDRSAALAPPAAPEARERRFLDLLLTAPVFVVYHLGVVFLDVRNGFDPITDAMLGLLERSLGLYLLLTFGLAAALAITVRVLGYTKELHPKRMALRLGEALVYAFVMAVVARNVASYTLGAKMTHSPPAAIVMSFGAGFYEEIAFRVILFGAGVWVIRRFTKGWRAIGWEIGWALCAACAFSAVHYVGALSDPLRVGSFIFRATCGVVLTVVYRLRGFAAAVWTHALYDVAVMI